MDNWLLAELLVDAGLFILTWMVQLIIYPGFLAYSPSDLTSWHKLYTPRITIIVAPLMLSQLALSLFHVITKATGLSLLVFLLVLLSWGTTFFLFVPIHERIGKGQATSKDLRRLVQRNWLRTGVWTLILILDLVAYIKITGVQ